MDRSSKTDGFCILSVMSGGLWKEIDMTEVVDDDLNPVFNKVITVDYMADPEQTFKIDIYDSDDSSEQLTLRKVLAGNIAMEYIGSVEFQLEKLVTSVNQEIELSIKSNARKNSGKIKVMCD